MALVEIVAVVERQAYYRSVLSELFVYSSRKSCMKSCSDTQAAVIVTERAKRMTLFRRKCKCRRSYFILQRWSLIKSYKKVNNT